MHEFRTYKILRFSTRVSSYDKRDRHCMSCVCKALQFATLHFTDAPFQLLSGQNAAC